MTAQKNQYKPPAGLRHQAAIKETWIGLPVWLPGLAMWPYAAYYNGWGHPGTLAMMAWVIGTALLLLYAYWWSMNNRAVVYEVNGVTCMWPAHEWYVPPEIYAEFLQEEVWDKFEAVIDKHRYPSAFELTDGVAILFEGQQPYARVREANGTIALKRVWGATQPWRRYSRVAGERRMDPGVDGYELKLHCCHKLFPGRAEGEDIAWMQEVGIL